MAASPLVDTPYASTVVFGTSGFTGEIIGADIEGLSRTIIPTTHFTTPAPVTGTGGFGGRTFIPGDLADPGQLILEVHFNPDKFPGTLVNAPAAETITITWTTGAIWTGSGIGESYEVHAEENDKMTARITIKLTGLWDVNVSP